MTAIPTMLFQALTGSDTNGNIYLADVIEYQGHFWLVPSWLVKSSTGVSIPERMIRVTHRIQKGAIPWGDTTKLVLTYPVPTPVLDGKSDKDWTVLERPGLEFQFQTPS